MFYPQNYGIYKDLVQGKREVSVQTKDITEETWQSHFDCIFNLLRDGIETPEIQQGFVRIYFDNGDSIRRTVIDYWFNLMIWKVIIPIDSIQPWHMFFKEEYTVNGMKKYIDKYFIEKTLSKIKNIRKNNIIDDCIFNLAKIDYFSFYLANTINLEDFVRLCRENQEFYNLIHCHLNTSLEDAKQQGMEATRRSIEIIKQSGYHCLANFFKAKEGVNIKQYKEFGINIGPKPDGKGGVFPTIINKNFITNGVNDIVSWYIESNTGRLAQVIVDGNVGDSGHFARLLGLNNSDSFLHKDPQYDCHTKNLLPIYIDNKETLERFRDRYFRFNKNGFEYNVNDYGCELIGKTIFLRSPMTCASAARGDGICYKCYGDLAYENNDINIGKIAAEILSSIFTQKMLSAKHLLEALVRELNWVEGFKDLFIIDYNTIKFDDMKNLAGYKIKINLNQIEQDEDESLDSSSYADFVSSFNIIYPDGTEKSFYTADLDNLYLSGDINELLNKMVPDDDDNYIIDAEDCIDKPLFVVKILNNDLAKTLNRIKNILDKKAITCEFTAEEILKLMVDTLNDGDVEISSVHIEILLMNQIRSIDDDLEVPNWDNYNEPYKILTLKHALEKNPSITVSLSFETISKALYSPITYRKHKPSNMDLFFMEQPQVFLKSEPKEPVKPIMKNGLEVPITVMKKNNK